MPRTFNKELSASDIKLYGKIHFNRSRSDNELNMYCHLIVSRKDQTNKKKLSPLTNHKNTQKGIVIGGFDRVNLFQQAERGFDKLFNYNRQQTESFEYQNKIRNGFTSEQLKLQEQEFQSNERIIEINQKRNMVNIFSINFKNKEAKKQDLDADPHIITNQGHKTSDNPLFNQGSSPILTSLTSPETNFPPSHEEQILNLKKKRRKKYKF